MMDDRAVSDVIGFVLVFGLVATTVAIVSLTGFNTLSDVRDGEQVDNAQRAFDVLADNLADIHQEGAPSRSTEVSLADAQIDTTSTITVNISWDSTTDMRPAGSREYRVTPIIWESTEGDDTQVVYSLGAVLRNEEGGGGVVVRETPFVLQQSRLILPIVRTQASSPESYAGSVVRVRGTGTGASSINSTTRPRYDEIWLNITTPRATIWRDHLDDKRVIEGCGINSTSDGDTVACRFEQPDSMYISVHTIELGVER